MVLELQPIKNAEAEKELVTYENDLMQAVLTGGSVATDSFDRGNAEDQDLLYKHPDNLVQI